MLNLGFVYSSNSSEHLTNIQWLITILTCIALLLFFILFWWGSFLGKLINKIAQICPTVYLVFFLHSNTFLVHIDKNLQSKHWGDIVLTLHFSRWHLLKTLENGDLCPAWLQRGEWWLVHLCFMAPIFWVSHISLRSPDINNLFIRCDSPWAHYHFLGARWHDAGDMSAHDCLHK